MEEYATDVLEAIRGRRSIRMYLSTPVETEKIRAILEAGQWAPSSANQQPWHFVVVTDSTTRKKLAEAHSHGRFMAESPVVFVVLSDPKRDPRYHLADAHNAVENMLLAAYSLGLGSCWMGVRDTQIEPRFREILGIPEELRVVCSVAVGYSAIKPTSTRFPLDQIVSYEMFVAKKK